MGALAKAAGEAKRQDDLDRAVLKDLVKDHPATADAADSFAKRMAIRQRILLQLYRPLAWAFRQGNYFEDDFAKDLAEKTVNIPEEHLQTPLSSVAYPAMQGLSCSFDEAQLKDMYLELLATASDDRRGHEAHPAFAEVIKQMTAAEAAVLEMALAPNGHPLVEVHRHETDDDGYNFALRHMTAWDDRRTGAPLTAADSALWIDNWARLGLVEVAYDKWASKEGAYDFAEKHPDYLGLIASAPEGTSYTVHRGVLFATSFGARFAAAVFGAEEGLGAGDVP